MPTLGGVSLLTAKSREAITYGDPGSNPKELRAMEWTDPWFIDYIHDDARDKEYATTWAHPTLMLRDLVADDLLCYPTTLCISGNDYGGVAKNDDRPFYPLHAVDGVTRNSNPEIERVLKSFSLSVVSLVRTCPYLDRGLAFQILNKGNIGATLGFLFTLLPNLTTLKVAENIYHFSHDFGKLRDVINNVLRIGYTTMNPHKVSPPLSKLNCVELKQDRDIWIYAPLFRLPSISSIRVDDVQDSVDLRFNCPGFHIKVNSSHSDSTSDYKVRSYRLFPERYTLSLKSHIATTALIPISEKLKLCGTFIVTIMITIIVLACSVPMANT